jgi:hypothetical protein
LELTRRPARACTETANEYFDYFGYPEQGRWKIDGLNLPDQVLEKIYHPNAEKNFGQVKGMAERRGGGQ